MDGDKYSRDNANAFSQFCDYLCRHFRYVIDNVTVQPKEWLQLFGEGKGNMLIGGLGQDSEMFCDPGIRGLFTTG